MDKKQIEEMIDLAIRQLDYSYAPYSHFHVGAALLAKNGTYYTGCNIENAAYGSTMCAERNAIANMITNGENEIIKLVCVDSKGNVGSPCGACREYMMQLSKNSKDIEILKNIDTKEIVKLEELIPDWWGKGRV